MRALRVFGAPHNHPSVRFIVEASAWVDGRRGWLPVQAPGYTTREEAAWNAAAVSSLHPERLTRVRSQDPMEIPSWALMDGS